jgi:hypothetical protein
MVPSDLLPWALRVLETERDDELQVFADRVLESGWYDIRVVWCLVPASHVGHRLSPSMARKRRAQLARRDLEAPNMFRTHAAEARYSSAASWRWVRAVAAVLLFADWPTKPYGLIWRNMKAFQQGLREHSGQALRILHEYEAARYAQFAGHRPVRTLGE